MIKGFKMTREEALRNIKELEEYIKKLDKAVGYKEDKMFLLSEEEYEKYKDVIPKCRTSWWLRSFGIDDEHIAYVDSSGWVRNYGCLIDTDDVGVRPVLKINTFDYKTGRIFTYKNFPFTVIDKDLAIATVPITFDMFDIEKNIYELSNVRQFLLKWG